MKKALLALLVANGLFLAGQVDAATYYCDHCEEEYLADMYSTNRNYPYNYQGGDRVPRGYRSSYSRNYQPYSYEFGHYNFPDHKYGFHNNYPYNRRDRNIRVYFNRDQDGGRAYRYYDTDAGYGVYGEDQYQYDYRPLRYRVNRVNSDDMDDIYRSYRNDGGYNQDQMRYRWNDRNMNRPNQYDIDGDRYQFQGNRAYRGQLSDNYTESRDDESKRTDNENKGKDLAYEIEEQDFAMVYDSSRDPQAESGHYSDHQLLEKLRNKIESSSDAPKFKDVQVHVSDGVVNLEGTVESDSLRKEIVKKLRRVEGVKEVNDNLRVKK